MKFIGFISEHTRNKYSISYNDFLLRLKEAPEGKVFEVLEMLSSGEALLATMGFFSDINSGEEIGPVIYYTNGEWVWPSYLAHYIEKEKKIFFEGSFINDILSSKSKIVYDKPKAIKELLIFLND